MSFDELPQDVRDLVLSYWNPVQDIKETLEYAHMILYEVLIDIKEVASPDLRDNLMCSFYQFIQASKNVDVHKVLLHMQIKKKANPFGFEW